MNCEDLMTISDDILVTKLKNKKEKLFDLYEKLNLDLLRFGVMSLTFHDNTWSHQTLLEMEDILYELSVLKTDSSILLVEKSRRERLKNEVL